MALLGAYPCFLQAPNDNARPNLTKLTLTLQESVALDQSVTRRLVSVELHGAETLTFCGHKRLAPEVATISLPDPARLAGDDTPPEVSELQLGSDAEWDLTVTRKETTPDQIELSARAILPAKLVLYGRPRAALGQETCDDSRVPTVASGHQLRIVAHLSSTVGASPARLLGELWPSAASGALVEQSTMVLESRLKTCEFRTASADYAEFRLHGRAKRGRFHEVEARPRASEIVVHSLALAERGLQASLEWGADSAWEGGQCGCRCLSNIKELLGGSK